MEEKKKLIVLVVLGVAAVFSLIYGIITPSSSRRKPRSEPSDARIEQITQSQKVVSILRRPKRSKYASWGRNPFMLFSAPVKTSIGFHLDGIIWDNRAPLAVINDEVVGIGDKVGTNTIVEIRPDMVVLNDGTKNIELNLNQ